MARPHQRKKAEQRVLDPDAEWAAEIRQRLLDSCHPKQRAFVEDPSVWITALVGRGGGKTTGGIARFLIRMTGTAKARCLYVALTKEDARDLIWGKLKDACERLGLTEGQDVLFHEARLVCTIIRTGSTLRIVGADDQKQIDKQRGKPFHEVGCDEAAFWKAKLLANFIDSAVGPRLGDYNGTMWLVSNAGHTLAGYFYDATRPGSDQHRPYESRDLVEFKGWDNWSSHHWTAFDPGAQHIPEIKAFCERAYRTKTKNKWSDDNPIWKREYLAIWTADNTTLVFQYRAVSDDGSPWNVWDPKKSPLGIAELPPGNWHFIYTGDVGGSVDPSALNIFAFNPDDSSREMLHVYCHEQMRMFARGYALRLLGSKPGKDGKPEPLPADNPKGLIGATGWPDGAIMDGDLPTIDELGNVYGVAFIKAKRERDYKAGAIELVNSDLVDGRIRIMKGSKLEEQLLSLQWAVDEYGDVKEDKAQANHCTDCLIYGRVLVRDMFGGGQEEDEKRDGKERKRLKRQESRRDVRPADDDDEPIGSDFARLFDDADYGMLWRDK